MPHSFPKIVFASVLAAASLLLLALAAQPARPQTPPKRPAAAAPAPPSETSPSGKKPFAGSKTCYDCHTKFYELWSTSRHGLAMQPYSPAFAKKELKPQAGEVVIGKQSFRAEIGEKQGWVRETGRRQGDALPDRPRHGRQERLLFPHADAQGPLAGPARGLRRPQADLVRHDGQRRAALPRSPPARRGPALDRSALHLQHHLLRLPRQPTGDQLRPGNRHLSHHVARGGHQLRVVPRPRRRARPGHGGRRSRATPRKTSRSSARSSSATRR